MAEAIRMPLLSDTMKEGTIATWHKKVGDKVSSDDVIADVETDKAVMEVMPYVDGTLLYIGVEQGQAAPINGIIAIVGKEGEDYQSILDEEKAGDKLEGENADSEKKENSDEAANENPEVKAKAPETSAGGEEKKDAPAEEKKPSAPKSKDATAIRMPLLSDTMKEGKIVAWHKKEGDEIKQDDVLADVETDKATMEVMPYVDGTLLYVGVKEGEAAKVNDIIAIVGKPGTDIQPFLEGDDDEEAEETATRSKSVEGKEQSANGKVEASKTEDSQPTESSNKNGSERVFVSPLAKKMASEKGIDLHDVQGSGDGGRIIRRDIEDYKPTPQSASGSAAKSSQNAVAAPSFNKEEGYTDAPLSQMRKVIAQRLGDSKFSAPHFYLRTTITMDKAMDARKMMNEVSPVKISFNDLIIKACAMALRMHPEVNSSWMGESIRTYQHVHIGTAVAVDEGLIVPVVKFADQKSLSQIADEAGKLIEKARNKKLQPPEFTGNTFTISNLGMMDIDEFTAIINPPDACILAVGKIAATPVVENNEVVVRQLMKLTLSCDHRVVDGAVGARFLQTLKSFLESPVVMLV